GGEARRQLDHLDAGLEPDRLRPTAEETVLGAVGDAVDLSGRTARWLAGDETLIAVVACLVDVEEGDDVAFFDLLAVNVLDAPTGGFHDADRHVAGDDGIGNAQTPMVQMDVSPANFGVQRAEDRRTGFEEGSQQSCEPERLVWSRHDHSLVSTHRSS